MRRLCSHKAIAFLLISSFAFAACEDKNNNLLKDKTQNERVNEWIYSEMDSQYLYYRDMPKATSVNYKQDTKDFFASLLSRQQEMKTTSDGREYFYSYIEVPENTKVVYSANQTYGLEFVRYSSPTVSGTQIARILYVLKGSPAERAGLKRGDFIYKVNGERLNATNYALLKSGQAITVYQSEYIWNESNEKYEYAEYNTPIKLDAAEAIDENPIHYSKILEFGSRKIGYLVYNAFKYGPTDDGVDFRYENEMRNLMKSFKNQGVSDLILDLRYNGGGYLRTAQLLASTIVPEGDLGHLMAYQEMNDKLEKTNKEKEINFYSASVLDGANLNLDRLVVIGTRFTASASELIINALRPYMSVIHVGERTEGKNVGSYSIKNEKFPGYKIQPITIKIYNARRESDYRNGFVPEALNSYSEIESARPFASFGSTDDPYVKLSLKALGIDVAQSQKQRGYNVQIPELKFLGISEINNPKGLICE